jgi:hypothetical protein
MNSPGQIWLIPWRPFADCSESDPLSHELRSELCPQHILFGVPARPIGRRQDCDDVLFELLDGSCRLAVVHLTYAQRPEPDPRWPEAEVFENWTDFETRRMRAEADNWNGGAKAP